MALAMPRRHSPAATDAAALLAAGLVVRRGLDCYQLLRCRAHNKRLRAAHRAAAPASISLHLIVPLYHEQLITEDTIEYWSKTCLAHPDLNVVLVTTAKETASGTGPTTSDVVRERLGTADTQAERYGGLCHLHVTATHQYRAIQINTAIDTIRHEADESPERVWIGIYNADSRPDQETFDELARAITSQPGLRAYQQLARYMPPPEGRSSSPHMTAFAALQTWWTYSRYSARLRRGTSPVRWWAHTSPYSMFGHGEFLRLDLIDAIGGFPDFAYADGLLVGWLLRFGGEPIGALASSDHAEVPRRPAHVIGQHRAWTRGLLNIGAAARRSRPLHPICLSRTERRVLLGSHLAIPLLWGLRPLAAAATVAWIAVQPRRAWPLTAVFALYSAIPQLAALARATRHMNQPPSPPTARHVATQCAAGALATVIDGIGLWPALLDKATTDQAPPKTPR